jgi:hypothetical protein
MSDYQIADRTDSRALGKFLLEEGQFLLPLVNLIETAKGAIDEVIDLAGRATIEAGSLFEARPAGIQGGQYRSGLSRLNGTGVVRRVRRLSTALAGRGDQSALVAIAQVPWHFSFEVTDAENWLSPAQATAGRGS